MTTVTVPPSGVSIVLVVSPFTTENKYLKKPAHQYSRELPRRSDFDLANTSQDLQVWFKHSEGWYISPVICDIFSV